MSNKVKKRKMSNGSVDTSAKLEVQDIVKECQFHRLKMAPSVSDFKFNKSRIRVLSQAKEVRDTGVGILYWMSRDQRVQDNWAMLYAQKLALKNKVSLHVCFCLVPKFLDATIRHYEFLLRGLEEVERECREINIKFHLLLGQPGDVLPRFVTEHNMGAVVTDFSPLRIPRKWVDEVTAALPHDVPLCQVDAHNIVPCWIASDKLEYAARTIRNKINNKLPEFLTGFPPVIKHPYNSTFAVDPADWQATEQQLQVDRSVTAVSWASPGTAAGLAELASFCLKRLGTYASQRNDPMAGTLSRLSPWLHFGQISAQRCILKVKEFKSQHPESVSAFCEECIVRRELSDNFCFYNDRYDSVDGTNEWARKTLDDHRKDKRQHEYTREQLDGALTHDALWNSAQKELVKDGKMHGFMRMYWAKKILEWSKSPEDALATAIYLNDRYSLDGRDPNGFVGCMWSVCGVHDQGWAERPVFGKIRYMNYEGCKRKFDVAGYVARWGGHSH